MNDLIQYFQKQASNFETEAKAILAKCEDSATRVISIKSSQDRLKNLSVVGKVYLEEALGCVERGFYHSAIITAWVAFIDTLERKITENNFINLHAVGAPWTTYSSLEELCEKVTEHSLIEVAYKMKLLSKTEKKTIHGLLAKRNEVAHPSGYMPDMNESLGYISEVINRIEILSKK